MTNTHQQFPFYLRMMGAESRVRGIYLSVACDFENLMSDIIAICEESDKDNLEDNRLKQPLEIGAKLKRCKAVVEIHNKKYYDFLAQNFPL